MRMVAIGAGLVVLGLLFSGCVAVSEGGTGADASAPPVAKPAEASDDTGGIEGIVVNGETQAIANAQLALKDTTHETVTDATGRYSFSHVAPGGYVLLVGALGHGSAARNVQVQAGEILAENFVLEQVAIAEWYPLTKPEVGNIMCSVRAYPGVPTGGVGGLPPWTTGVAVCGAAPVPGNPLPPDRFLINYAWEENPQEVLMEMEWKTTQALGKGLSVVLEHSGHPNAAAFTFGRDTGESSLSIHANETTMLAVAESSGIDCSEKKCPVYTRVFAEANTTNLFLPGTSPDLGPLGKPPWKIDAGFVLDQKFFQYMTTFFNGPRPEGYSALPDQ